jgi:hypothetical protein
LIQDKEWVKAKDAVTDDLSTKLTAAIGAAPRAKAASALMAGIANGSVYINQETATGVKVGDRFQVVREVSLGRNDPASNRHYAGKQEKPITTERTEGRLGIRRAHGIQIIKRT